MSTTMAENEARMETPFVSTSEVPGHVQDGTCLRNPGSPSETAISALLLHKGVRSAPKGSAELGPHGKAVTTQGAFGGHRRQRTAPRLE